MDYREPQHYRITMLFPMRYGRRYGGGLVPNIVWKWWRRELTSLLPGGTYPGIVKGWWYRQWDTSRMVWTIIEANRTEAVMDSLKEFLAEAALEFKQDAMYLECSAVYYEDVEPLP